MIFVTVGTHHDPMPRLMDALGALPAQELVVQHGTSPPPPRAARATPYMPFDEVLACIDAAEVVIAHAGVGTMLCATRAGHTPLVVPRLKRFGEHVDDHQSELARALSERSTVVGLWDLDRLPEAVAAAPPRRAGPPSSVERPLHAAVRAALNGGAPPGG